MVESVGSEVGPYGAVVLAVHESFFESFEDFFLAFEVCLALVVYLVEVNAHALVGLVESGINPFVHALPQGAYFGVFVLPGTQHGAGFLHEG